MQETDVAIKALSGLDQLRTALSVAPAAIRSNINALGSWLASVVQADDDAAAILRTLEREVRLDGPECLNQRSCMKLCSLATTVLWYHISRLGSGGFGRWLKYRLLQSLCSCLMISPD